MRCPTCGGCTDDMCRGTCDAPRWCSGTYTNGRCNRCPHTKLKPTPGTRGGQMLPCAADARHTGICHWDQRLAGTQPTTQEPNP